MPDVIREREMYTDDVKMIAELIKDQWSLGPNNAPNVTYIPEQIMVSARVGYIFVYPLSRSNQISSTDYHTLQRTSHVSIKVATRYREDHFAWCEEVYRIILSNRRAGEKRLHGWAFMEITGDRQTTDLSGWYSTTIELKLTTYNKPIRSAGFGDRINKQIEELADQTSDNGD